MKFFDICNLITEGQFVQDNFKLITPKKYSHALFLRYNGFRLEYHLFKVIKDKNLNLSYVGVYDKDLPEYEGKAPPRGWEVKYITTGKEINYNYDLGYDEFSEDSYYTTTHSIQTIKKSNMEFEKAWLKPVITAQHHMPKGSFDPYKNLMDTI